MLKPNVPCVIIQTTGTDVYGQEMTAIRKREFCSIVTLLMRDEKTSVRADSSATRGTARENTVKAVLLFSPKTIVSLSDRVQVGGMDLKVSGKFPRYDVAGRLDHYQIEAGIWE